MQRPVEPLDAGQKHQVGGARARGFGSQAGVESNRDAGEMVSSENRGLKPLRIAIPKSTLRRGFHAGG